MLGGVLNVINFNVSNLVGGKYSVNRSPQEVISIDEDSTPAVYQLNLSDFTIFSEANSMLELKIPKPRYKS